MNCFRKFNQKRSEDANLFYMGVILVTKVVDKEIDSEINEPW